MNCTSNNFWFMPHSLKTIYFNELLLTINTKITLLNSDISFPLAIMNNITGLTKNTFHYNITPINKKDSTYINHSLIRQHPFLECKCL